MAALAIAFDKCGTPGWSGFGENHVDLEMFCRVSNVGFPIPCALQKALTDIPFDVEFVYVSLVLYLTP